MLMFNLDYKLLRDKHSLHFQVSSVGIQSNEWSLSVGEYMPTDWLHHWGTTHKSHCPLPPFPLPHVSLFWLIVGPLGLIGLLLLSGNKRRLRKKAFASFCSLFNHNLELVLSVGTRRLEQVTSFDFLSSLNLLLFPSSPLSFNCLFELMYHWLRPFFCPVS